MNELNFHFFSNGYHQNAGEKGLTISVVRLLRENISAMRK